MRAVTTFIAALYSVVLLVAFSQNALAEASKPVHAQFSDSVLTKAHSDRLSQYPSLQPAPLHLGCRKPDATTLAAIVRVATDHGSHASGVIFDTNRVLTAAHAVQGAGHFFVSVAGAYRSADLVRVDHAHDLAVLAVNTSSVAPLLVSGFSPRVFSPVWAAGYPRAEEMSTSMGVFQEIANGALHSSAEIDPGQSGGGLLSCSDGQWSLVGMLRGYGAYHNGDHYVKLENHSVSVAGTTINTFLQSYY